MQLSPPAAPTNGAALRTDCMIVEPAPAAATPHDATKRRVGVLGGGP